MLTSSFDVFCCRCNNINLPLNEAEEKIASIDIRAITIRETQELILLMWVMLSKQLKYHENRLN